MLKDLQVDLEKKCQPAKPNYDFLKEYDLIYSQLSDHAHSSPRLIFRFHGEDSYRPAKSEYTTVAWSAMDWLSQIIGFTAAAFDLGFDKTVDEAQKRAQGMLPEDGEQE